jgi:para-nitrobenzyl esterase
MSARRVLGCAVPPRAAGPLGVAIAVLLGAAGCRSPAALSAPVPPSESTDASIVATDRGPVRGRLQAGVREFLGIPYARPPIAERRWRPPEEPEAWNGVRDATQRSPSCAQLDTDGFVRESSEDCLYLNLWVPLPREAPPRPVLFWIPGGAFYQGSGGDALYDGAKLAARTGALVITINYRLGPFGFLSHRELAREAGRTASPAHGLLDQQAALRWVQRNVSAFGGDPTRVTIFGCSAGAWSVCSQMAMPSSRGLFAGAIMESGSCADILYSTAKDAEEQGDRFAAALGCDSLACLRQKPADQIVRALPMKRSLLLPPGVWWGPVIDGVELPEEPLQALKAGRGAGVPLIIGWNTDEGILHTVRLEQVSATEVEGFVRAGWGAAAAAEVPAAYLQRSPKEALTEIVTDGAFACESRRAARALSARGVPVYLYEMTHPLDDPRVHGLGATHSVELFFVFDNVDRGFGILESERALSGTFMDAWGRFAKTGDPNGPGLRWPRYSEASDELAVLDLVPSTRRGRKRTECDLWDRVWDRVARPPR